MFKNISLRTMSFLGAMAITLFAVIMIWIGEKMYFIDFDWNYGYFMVVAIGLFTFLTIQFILDRYIYRRIKLIYKIIRQSKISVPDKRFLRKGTDPILDGVEQEVQQWAETQQNEIETLKTLEAYRKRFIGNVSHELKTPIFSIQGYIYTLIDGGLYDENVNLKYLERAASNVDRLLTIVQDLEEISKLESEDLILDLQKFDIKSLVKEVFNDLEVNARPRNVNLTFKEGADKSYMVMADREGIRQVLTNLILNSIKYGIENGVTKVSFYVMDKQILVEVSDNGLGIEEKHLKHLFDRFYRVDKSRSRESGGSGLGLSIVKHILEAHNQSVNVRSTPGKGSTFGFTLDKAVD
ncbi:MAG: sensor histidine kinase [Saprospiraceae bacterium]|nr:sensor histidine kinase [Saprospiraceae bacterium]